MISKRKNTSNSLSLSQNPAILPSFFILSLLLALMVALPVFASSDKSGNDGGDGKDTVNIVTSIYPLYDWTLEIAGKESGSVEGNRFMGEGISVSLLINGGIDMHSFQPSAQDILSISECDLFIYVGGESDAWVRDVLALAVNPDMKVLNLLDLLGDKAREEELQDGMQDDDHDHDDAGDDHSHDDADDDHDHNDDDEDHDSPEYDEHIWLSVKNAGYLVPVIAEAMAEICPENADTYASNAEVYREKLAELDKRYEEAVSSSPGDTLLFADRFPFRYLVDDYGLDYYAAFPGCSAETEASFETVAFLSEKVSELGLKSICVIEGSDGKLAETVIATSKGRDLGIVVFDSMQASSYIDPSPETAYLNLMEVNLEALEKALDY